MRRGVALALAACHAPIAPPPLCRGDDDTAALQRALDGGGRVTLDAGATCRLSQLTVTAPVELDLAGSRLRVIDGAASPHVIVRGDRVAIRHGTIDGAAGWLVDWRGAGGALDDVVLQHGEIGLSVTAGDVTARRSVARGADIGFRVGAGALISDDCGAEGNAYAGFFVSQAAARATVIDGWTAHNGIGVAIDGPGGRIARLRSRDDDRFGVLLDHGASGWRVGSVRVEQPGKSAHNPSATGVELFAQDHDNAFDDVTVIDAPGYGVAIAGGSYDNRFGRIALDARGSWDGDPGVVIAGGSHRNHLGDVRVIGHTVGVRIGENDAALDARNDDNRLDAVYVAGARYTAIRIERGDRNTIGQATIADSDSSGSDAQGFRGLVYFGNDATGNRVARLVQVDGPRVPSYVIYAGPDTADNHVDHVTARAWSVALSQGVAR